MATDSEVVQRFVSAPSQETFSRLTKSQLFMLAQRNRIPVDTTWRNDELQAAVTTGLRDDGCVNPTQARSGGSISGDELDSREGCHGVIQPEATKIVNNSGHNVRTQSNRGEIQSE